MAFPVFASGDILNASDMNAVGLWKIGGATFTTVTGFNLPNSSFSSTYQNYRLFIRITAVATDADFTGRMRASGSNDTGSNYDWGFAGVTNSGAASDSGGAAQTAWVLGEQDNSTIYGTFWIDFFGPNLAANTRAFAQFQYVDKAASAAVYRSGGLTHRAATAYDSFAFISTQNISGEYWLYGYRNN